MTFFCLGVTLAVQFPPRVTREYSFRHFQVTFGSLARIPDRADDGVRRVGCVCHPRLDQPAGFTVRHYDCQPHGGQPSHSFPIRLMAPVRGAPATEVRSKSTRHYAAGHGLLQREFPRRRYLTCSTNLLSDAANLLSYSNWKFTLMVVCTSAGTPFTKYGL